MSLVDAYLRSLPNGARSFPECRARAEIFEEVIPRVQARAPAAYERLTRQWFAEGVPRSEWLPETFGNALLLFYRETCFDSDAGFLRDAYEVNGALYQRPLYRALMLVLSPTLVLMGASKRWPSFRVGTNLRAKPVRRVGEHRATQVVLEHPPGLHTPFHLAAFAEAFRAAADAAGARDASVTVAAESEPGRAVWDVRYL